MRDELAADGVDVDLVASVAVVGGGGAPELELPSWALSLPEGYGAALRLGDPPVLGRVERGRLLLDLRCVPSDADPSVLAAVRAVADALTLPDDRALADRAVAHGRGPAGPAGARR
jgi:L-seryl-tRNA(Ser) seleniumtransferase